MLEKAIGAPAQIDSAIVKGRALAGAAVEGGNAQSRLPMPDHSAMTQGLAEQPPEFVLAGYAGSRDYERLAALASKASIICIVDYDMPGVGTVRDIARTQYTLHRKDEVFMVSARGISYIHAFGKADFIGLCEFRQVEFIEPLLGGERGSKAHSEN
ncbi:hypothetical protein [Paraburkholderia humisilvae]|uniref:Uncharacterized protein n=1 Tax=Paraburkholderia humisilvae TaxID=627669 RepID=A0A6J5DIQ9_9BURK|nr:hypothetical protein [Paraburkholderia humisilvae]CAB3754069.1 hypothetical protein LMG29542_02238 [Paraburkholderia humisilvae]